MNEFLKLARERLRRARALPVGPARNDQRQIALALKAMAVLVANTEVRRSDDVREAGNLRRRHQADGISHGGAPGGPRDTLSRDDH
jgi:hypothetical protein